MEDSSRVPNSGDFVPFMRTSEVLDPAHADSPLPVSREPTDMVKARRAYQRELNPARYGQMMDNRMNLHVSINSVCFSSIPVCTWTTWTSLKSHNLPVQRLSRYVLVIHLYHMSKPSESSFTEYVVHTVLSSSDSDLFILALTQNL